MIIDTVYGIVLCLGLIRGFMRGLVLSVFSFLAFFLGIAGALKFSHFAAAYMEHAWDISSKYTPILAFLAVFVLIIIFVHIISRVIQKFLEFAQINFANKIAGSLLLGFVYTFIISTLLWLADQAGWLSEAMIDSSRSYAFISPIAPVTIKYSIAYFPFFEDMLAALEKYFKQI